MHVTLTVSLARTAVGALLSLIVIRELFGDLLVGHVKNGKARSPFGQFSEACGAGQE